jgi:hypothetical protein
LPDAADRIRLEPRAVRRAKPGWSRALAPKKRGTIAGAALAAMMIGIVVNALALQHGRRLVLAPDRTAVAAITPQPPTAARPPPRAPSAAAPVPAPRPSPTTLALAHAPKSGDAIADFLRAHGPDRRRLTLAAQDALGRLGFAVKATGTLDAQTRSALSEFEKSRHMPVSGEITAKLVRTLKAAAAR